MHVCFLITHWSTEYSSIQDEPLKEVRRQKENTVLKPFQVLNQQHKLSEKTEVDMFFHETSDVAILKNNKKHYHNILMISQSLGKKNVENADIWPAILYSERFSPKLYPKLIFRDNPNLKEE